MYERNRKRSDALAQLSGKIQAWHESEHIGEISIETLAAHFNETLEDCDIDSDVLQIE